jgi:hypothetical protein
MTRDRDIERVLERWFAEGPTQMPDHLFNEVVDRIDRIPQRRLAALQSRFSAMSLNIRIAGIAAIIVLAAGIGALALGGPRAVVVSPSASVSPTVTTTPSPIATPAASAAAALVPDALQHLWIGPTRTITAMNPAPESAALVMSQSTVAFDGGPAARTAFFSNASTVAADRLQLVLNDASVGCTVGDVGTYTFTLSPGGGSLALTLVDDACAARSQAMAGDWVRSVCPNSGACLGDLEAGRHVSATFNPFVAVTDYVYVYGRVSYTVPDGWSNTIDGRNGYILVKQGAPPDAAIYLFSTAYADSQAAGCPGSIEPGVGHSASALASWLRTLPGLVTTKPASVNLGGLRGTTLDVSVAANWKRTCPYSNGKPMVAMFTNGQSAEADNFDWGLGAGARMRLFLLDLPDGRTMLIDLEAQDQTTWADLVRDATPIVNSFQFNR